jgi:hypothetical protein
MTFAFVMFDDERYGYRPAETTFPADLPQNSIFRDIGAGDAVFVETYNSKGVLTGATILIEIGGLSVNTKYSLELNALSEKLGVGLAKPVKLTASTKR